MLVQGWHQTSHGQLTSWDKYRYPFPPLQTPGLARDGIPGGGGGTVAK